MSKKAKPPKGITPGKEKWEKSSSAPTVPLPPVEAEKPPAPRMLPALDLDKPVDDAYLEKVALAVALFDPRRCADADGNGLLVSELDEWTALALSSLDIEEIWEYPGEGQPRVNIGQLKKYKIEGRLKAIELIWKKRGVLSGDQNKETKKNLFLEYMAACRGE